MTSQQNNDRNKKSNKTKKTSVIIRNTNPLSRRKRESSRVERQRAAVQRFRKKEKQRVCETLEQIRRMRQEVAIINTAIDKMDEDMDLMRELIEIQKGHQLRRQLEQRLASSQSHDPAFVVNTHEKQLKDPEAGCQTLDLSEMLSSPSDLARMANIIRYDAKSNPSRE